MCRVTTANPDLHSYVRLQGGQTLIGTITSPTQIKRNHKEVKGTVECPTGQLMSYYMSQMNSYSWERQFSP